MHSLASCTLLFFSDFQLVKYIPFAQYILKSMNQKCFVYEGNSIIFSINQKYS